MDNARHSESGRVPLLVVMVAATGVLTGAVGTTLKIADGSHPTADTVLTGLSGSLFVVAGLVAHTRRPANRTGLLMMLVGVAFFAEDLQLSTDSAVFTVGLLFAHASSASIVHLVLAFPDGRLPNRTARLLTVGAYVAVFALSLLHAIVTDWTVLPGKPRNLLLVTYMPTFGVAVGQVLDLIGVVVAAGVVVSLAHRFLAAERNARTAIAPVLLIAMVGGVASALGDGLGPHHALYPVLGVCYKAAFCLWPLAFLAGALGTRPRGAVIADLLVAARRSDDLDGLRETLATALRDPSLRVGRWDAGTGSFVDADGRPVAAGTLLRNHDGLPVGALSRREVPWEHARTAESVTALAGLVLDNQRLTAAASERLAEVHASRARLVTAAVDERRRVERDLHDGAQQRLVVVALGIQLAREQLADGRDPELAALLGETAAGIAAAITELRELARGIHPALLVEAGLAAAVAELVERTPLAVELTVADLPDLPAAVATTAYFVVTEALTNVLKHAAAQRVRVRLELRGDRLRVAVVDDGVGGARPAAGLAGLRDRVRALDGELTVSGAPGVGTTVVADIPRR